MLNTPLVLSAFFFTAVTLSAKNVSYTFGNVELVEDSNTTRITTPIIGESIPNNLFVGTGPGSRIEVTNGNDVWRLGSVSFASWKADNHFWIHSGSALYSSKEEKKVIFSTRHSSCTFTGKGTIIVEALQNGGLKFIPFEASGSIYTDDGTHKNIKDGRLLLILDSPSRLGDAYDIDLMLMLKSSRLINAFPDLLPTFGQMYLALYVQQLTLKGKFDALIGDAPTNDNLQLWAFGKNLPTKSPKSPKSK